MKKEDFVIDESGYMNEAMKKMAEKIFAEEKKSKPKKDVIPINNNNRVINVKR